MTVTVPKFNHPQLPQTLHPPGSAKLQKQLRFPMAWLAQSQSTKVHDSQQYGTDAQHTFNTLTQISTLQFMEKKIKNTTQELTKSRTG